MNSLKRPRSEPAADGHHSAAFVGARLPGGPCGRRPVALVAVNAPAFAASTSCLTAKWTEAAYSGANGSRRTVARGRSRRRRWLVAVDAPAFAASTSA